MSLSEPRGLKISSRACLIFNLFERYKNAWPRVQSGEMDADYFSFFVEAEYLTTDIKFTFARGKQI